VFLFHSTNVPNEVSWLVHWAVFDSCFCSLAERSRQSGCRLKFPANRLTVPDICRLQWSQMIRISFLLFRGNKAHQMGAHPLALTLLMPQAAEPPDMQLLNDPGLVAASQRQVEDSKQVRMKGFSDARSE